MAAASASQTQDAGERDADVPPKSDAATPQQEPMVTRVARSACATADARSCGGNHASEVLVCRDGAWASEQTCPDGQRCVADGSNAARCQVNECQKRGAGTAFCDATGAMRVCLDQSTSRALPCGPLERCVTRDDRARCGCIPGAVDLGNGCMMATTCTVGSGGCDPLTDCVMGANGPSCTACPAGYTGDGMHGCAPQLIALRASCGELQPAFDPSVHDYRVLAPTSCQVLALSGAAGKGSHVELNGEQRSEQWSFSDWPKVGSGTLTIQVTSQFEISSSYNFKIERNGAQAAYLKASNAGASDSLGFNIGASADSLVAGAPYEDSASATDPANDSAADSGAAYVFTPADDGWQQQGYLKADPPRAGSFFGTSVAISGDTLVVGAPGADPLQYAGATGASAGAAHVFSRKSGKWTLDQVLTPSSTTPGSLFGFKVAIQGDTILVSAAAESTDAARSGSVYVFTRQAGSWTETQRLKASSPNADSLFGFSVALDKDTLLVGASQDSSKLSLAGAAYVFVREGGMWKEQQRLDPADPMARSTFGWQLALHGDTAVVTAPSVSLLQDTPSGRVLVFERSMGRFQQRQVLTAAYPRRSDLYGSGVALTDTALLIGANGDDSAGRGAGADASRMDGDHIGAAYLYARQDDGTWRSTAYLKSDNGDNADAFGQSVALTDKALFLSAPFESSATRAINGDGDNNGAFHAGAIYVYR